MAPISVRPAEPADVDRACGTFPDLLPDRWRDGGNRRSFVAVRRRDPRIDGANPARPDEIVGHCRGIDNAVHPLSRVLVLEVVPELHGTEAERSLLRALLRTSPLPLHSKVGQKDEALRALLLSAGSVLVQLMPPWRYRVDAHLQDWARSTLETSDGTHVLVPADRLPAEQILVLEVDHYIAQHAPWSPAASRAALLEHVAGDHDPANPGTWDREHSWAVTSRDGRLEAAALVWGDAGSPEAPACGDDAPEVGYMSRRYDGREAWAAKLLAIAGVILGVPVGTELCIDSHLGMREEFDAIGTIPGADREAGEWGAIVATPAPGGWSPVPLDASLIPDAASWAREFVGT